MGELMAEVVGHVLLPLFFVAIPSDDKFDEFDEFHAYRAPDIGRGSIIG